MKPSSLFSKLKILAYRVITTPSGYLRTRELESQKKVLHSTDWDVLIILDACRYDFFKSEIRSFIGGGRLQKLRSPASWTYSWLSKIFGKKYDITIYSPHPGINSKGIGRRMGYVASKHFKRIVDVWDKGWDKDLSTVHPKTVNEAVMNDIKNGEFSKKSIIWYVQPHSPWIGDTKLVVKSDKIDEHKEVMDTLLSKMKDGEIPKETLMRAYRDNLRIVLTYVKKLLPHLSGKVVISADHGELLGELGFFGVHPSYVNHPALREVPWLELELEGQKPIKKNSVEKSQKESSKDEDEAIIKKKLEALGYM